MKWSRRRDRQHGMISWSRRAGNSPHHASEPVRERKRQGFKLRQDSLEPVPRGWWWGGVGDGFSVQCTRSVVVRIPTRGGIPGGRV
jgi:hypothetical protein